MRQQNLSGNLDGAASLSALHPRHRYRHLRPIRGVRSVRRCITRCERAVLQREQSWRIVRELGPRGQAAGSHGNRSDRGVDRGSFFKPFAVQSLVGSRLVVPERRLLPARCLAGCIPSRRGAVPARQCRSMFRFR